jgi:hypothetical protein
MCLDGSLRREWLWHFCEWQYVKFDAEGSKKAKALVEKTTKEKDIAIVAEGTLDGDTLTVASLKEK